MVTWPPSRPPSRISASGYGSDTNSTHSKRSASKKPSPRVRRVKVGLSSISTVAADSRSRTWWRPSGSARSEEHTSELQSLMRISYAVFCLQKKTYTQKNKTTYELLSLYYHDHIHIDL